MHLVLAKGQFGSVDLSIGGAKASLSVNADVELGGGEVEGFAKFRSSNVIEIDEMKLVDAGLSILAEKFKTLAPMILAIKAEADMLLSAQNAVVPSA